MLLDRRRKYGVSLSHELSHFFIYFYGHGSRNWYKKHISEIPNRCILTFQKLFLKFRCPFKCQLLTLRSAMIRHFNFESSKIESDTWSPKKSNRVHNLCCLLIIALEKGLDSKFQLLILHTAMIRHLNFK